MVVFCVSVTSVAKVTNRLPFTRFWMATRAPGFCWLFPNSGSIESWEIPATFSKRLVTWLLTCDATSDSAPRLPGGVGFAADAAVVLPKAIRLMMSDGGKEGTEV